MTKLKAELNLMLIALGFFTRVPMPNNLDFSQEKLNQASRYFTLVGLIIGLLSGLIFWVSQLFFPPLIAVIITMIFSLGITGCFHEDGLADTCDGLGGGWTVEQKLSIMKDSRIGTYGAAGLWAILSLKLFTLAAIEDIVFALILGHTLSRACANLFIFALPYVSDPNEAKQKPLAESNQLNDLWIGLAIASCTLFWVNDGVLVLLGVLGMLCLILHWWFKRQVGGFTGDILGATQQVSEVVIYLTLLALQPSVSAVWSTVGIKA